jgi:hypothetical protein
MMKQAVKITGIISFSVVCIFGMMFYYMYLTYDPDFDKLKKQTEHERLILRLNAQKELKIKLLEKSQKPAEDFNVSQFTKINY